jgi:hypothetical protein
VRELATQTCCGTSTVARLPVPSEPVSALVGSPGKRAEPAERGNHAALRTFVGALAEGHQT